MRYPLTFMTIFSLLTIAAPLQAAAPVSILDVSAPSAMPASIEGKSEGSVKKLTSKPKPESAKEKRSASWTEIPEPSNLFMLALGITGLIAGRYAAKRKRQA